MPKKDIIAEFFKQDKRRFIKNFSKLTKKTQKRKIGIIEKFLFYLKKQKKIRHLKDVKKNNINEFIEHIKENGIYNKMKKRYCKLAPTTIQDYKSTLSQFVEKVIIRE